MLRTLDEMLGNTSLDARTDWLSAIGLTEDEQRAWKQIEPDFAKPITKERKRKSDFTVAIFLVLLTLPHAVVVIAVVHTIPNGLPHLKAP